MLYLDTSLSCEAIRRIENENFRTDEQVAALCCNPVAGCHHSASSVQTHVHSSSAASFLYTSTGAAILLASAERPTYTPPPERPSYTPPAERPSYTPPPEWPWYTPRRSAHPIRSPPRIHIVHRRRTAETGQGVLIHRRTVTRRERHRLVERPIRRTPIHRDHPPVTQRSRQPHPE